MLHGGIRQEQGSLRYISNLSILLRSALLSLTLIVMETGIEVARVLWNR